MTAGMSPVRCVTVEPRDSRPLARLFPVKHAGSLLVEMLFDQTYQRQSVSRRTPNFLRQAQLVDIGQVSSSIYAHAPFVQFVSQHRHRQPGYSRPNGSLPHIGNVEATRGKHPRWVVSQRARRRVVVLWEENEERVVAIVWVLVGRRGTWRWGLAAALSLAESGGVKGCERRRGWHRCLCGRLDRGHDLRCRCRGVFLGGSEKRPRPLINFYSSTSSHLLSRGHLPASPALLSSVFPSPSPPLQLPSSPARAATHAPRAPEPLPLQSARGPPPQAAHSTRWR